MSEMLERVGDAVVAVIREAQERNGATYIEGMKEALARAAIEAMREPIPALIDAGCRYVWDNPAPPHAEATRQEIFWRAVFGAALEEPRDEAEERQ